MVRTCQDMICGQLVNKVNDVAFIHLTEKAGWFLSIEFLWGLGSWQIWWFMKVIFKFWNHCFSYPVLILPRILAKHHFMAVNSQHFGELADLTGGDNEASLIFEAHDLSVGKTHGKWERICELFGRHVPPDENSVAGAVMSSFKIEHNYITLLLLNHLRYDVSKHVNNDVREPQMPSSAFCSTFMVDWRSDFSDYLSFWLYRPP